MGPFSTNCIEWTNTQPEHDSKLSHSNNKSNLNNRYQIQITYEF